MLNDLLQQRIDSTKENFLLDLPDWQMLLIVVAALFVVCVVADLFAALWIKRCDRKFVLEHRAWQREFLKTPAGQEAIQRKRRLRKIRLHDDSHMR